MLKKIKENKKNTWLLAVMELLFSCSTLYQEINSIYILLLDTSLVRWPHSWDSELNTWGEIPYQHALLYYFIYWTRTKWPSLSYSLNAKSLKSYPVQRVLMLICGLIAQWSVFLRSFFTHSHLNTRGRKENLIKLCKPDTQSRVCITFEKFPNLPSV